MLDEEGESEPTVQACHRQARLMMDAAKVAVTDEIKSEFLRLATEWLKMATEMGDLAGSRCGSRQAVVGWRSGSRGRG